ncbi:ribonuclease P protein subunit p14 isoform X1 [Phascolarctos cinereus]|uniref:Ribonuclease P protein subunit p14 isoform X1 n=2 Tax=Phascolarctos cinereus TaxID=38626 RepID=A0A6P5J1J7_PHACI|nr:ribonuclease P protein subunit p14 isoform X1 [Phascolarctos cinereus]
MGHQAFGVGVGWYLSEFLSLSKLCFFTVFFHELLSWFCSLPSVSVQTSLPGLINTMKHLSKNKLPSPATFERIVYKNPSEYHYMKVQLEFQDHGFRLTDAQFKQLIVLALRDLFGEVGAALPFDVLTYEEKTLSAILRICSSGLVKLWSSLTLLGSYQNKKCAFRVMQVSPFLLALSGNSREFILEE